MDRYLHGHSRGLGLGTPRGFLNHLEATLEEQYDVIVIGTGPGGGACASLLQKQGIKTLLLEKNSFVGGKMVSVDEDGYAYDLFPHGQVPMRGSAF